MNSNEKLAAGRLLLVRKAPWFAAAAMGLIPKEAPGLGTFGVSADWMLYWDPQMADRWAVSEIAAVLWHEVGHVLRDHASRRKLMAAEARLWNVAADCEINDDPLPAGLSFPVFPCPDKVCKHKPGAHEHCTPGKFALLDGDLAEGYYAQLRQQQEEQEKQEKQEGGGDEDQEGEGEGQGGQEGEGKGKPQVGAGWCGGGAGRELPGEEEGQGGGRSEADGKRIARQVAEAIRDEASHGRGTVPGGWARWAAEMVKPARVPWQQLLARAVRASLVYVAGAVDYTYRRPSRRQGSIGYGPGSYLAPSLHAPKPRVAVGVDTSGSMGAAELERAIAEVNGILRAAGTAVDFLACDASVHENKIVRSWQEAAAALKGGGGTDFRPIFDAVGKLRPTPDVFVFVTDGQGPAPNVAPEFGVIWLLVGGSHAVPYNEHGTITYGKVIEVDEEGVKNAR
jgi:predicted metal-dependent peptidase